MCQHMALHREVELVQPESPLQVQHGVQRVDLQGVPVLLVRRRGSPVAGGLLDAVLPGDAVPAVAAFREVGGVVGLALRHGRPPEVADGPVEPVEPAHRDGVVVVEDDREALHAFGGIRYLERDGQPRHAVNELLALATVLVLDPPVDDGAACYPHVVLTIA